MILLESLFREADTGETCCVVTNGDSKSWIFPLENIRTSLQLYQPSGPKGIILKAVLPAACHLSPFRKALGVSINRLAPDLDIRKLADSLFGNGWKAAAFGGTPCVDQKVTIQIGAGDRILGYIKITDAPHVGELFAHEAALLNYLAGKGLSGIPEVLYLGSAGRYWCFAQSSVKEPGHWTANKLTYPHWEFLSDMASKTQVSVSFDETDAWYTLRQLRIRCQELGSADRDVLGGAIDEIIDYWSCREDVFSFYHGDFTPWNTVVNGDRLGAFDFEYARSIYPRYLDAFHFFLQSELFVRHRTPGDIVRDFLNFVPSFKANAKGDPFILFKFYLLDVINLYLGRGGVVAGDEAKRLSTRIDLLRRFL